MSELSIFRVEEPEDFEHINPLEDASEEWDGLVAAGYNLSAEMLLAAYRKGIFPWSQEKPVLWFFTNPRMVLKPKDFKPSHSLRKRLRDAVVGIYKEGGKQYKLGVFLDQDSEDVLALCSAPRKREPGTWITPELAASYLVSRKYNFFHTIGCYVDGKLEGGLFFDSIGRAFYGESMFSRRPDLSKIALACLVALAEIEGVELIDCQQETPHLASMGARPISGKAFADSLEHTCQESPVMWSSYQEGFPLTQLIERAGIV